MSYDVLVFDPTVVSDADFPAWWEEQATWPEDHAYCDPALTTASLRAFHTDMLHYFPDLQAEVRACDALGTEPDPDRVEDLADYSIGSRLIYMTFFWSRAARAITTVETVALRHGVAVARVSEDSSIQRP